ncbi:unnamed protein product [Thlaspi arvense]|uniref:t-SNARE coiled-coil homology domain-containing protein n=1 Tax=Thlaspi arvense TaxID=13288 RepID=A0AAU9RXW2_THLAR|nr:unnamed protein product [Thlaspi arvense]
MRNTKNTTSKSSESSTPPPTMPSLVSTPPLTRKSKLRSKSEATAMETNRAKVVAMNAEIRRTKARLLEEVPKLQKLALKKIQSIPDGTESAVRQTGAGQHQLLIKTSNLVQLSIGTCESLPIVASSCALFQTTADGYLGDDYFQQSEESNQFREEYEMRKMKQASLEVISEGLDTLKNLALDMNEELDRQVPLMDEMETKVDKATADLKNTNVKMKRTLTQIRSSRNFCIDIILLCVILGIASYLYNVIFMDGCLGIVSHGPEENDI